MSLRYRVCVVGAPVSVHDLLRAWMIREYDVRFQDSLACMQCVSQSEVCCELFFCFLQNPISKQELEMLSLVKSHQVPAIIVVASEASMPRRDLFADFLTLPLGEAAVMQRVQVVLSLWESEVRNATYKRHYKEKLEEIARLEKLATEKEVLATEAVSALQAPIVTITRALVDVRA